MKPIFKKLIAGSYFFAALALFAMALLIMGWSLLEVVIHFQKSELMKGEFTTIMLQSVGAIVIAVAIIDVAKYMIEEEVYRSKELRSLTESREIMTKIITITAIAVSIEGLVYIFKAGIKDITLLVYPASLILVSVTLILGLGIFQKLNVAANQALQNPLK